jgi:hypothetical protein
MYFLHTVQKVISRWGSRVLQRSSISKPKQNYFNIVFSFADMVFLWNHLHVSNNLFFLTYFNAIFPSINSPIMMIA